MKAYDLLVQAESGLAAITGHPAGPGRAGVSVCDIACGMSAYAAILEALIARGRNGQGQALQISLFDSVADWMNVPLLQQAATGVEPARVGLAHPTICPYGAFATADGTLILVAIQNEREWAAFCSHFLEEPGLPAMEGYGSNVQRVANRAAVDGKIAARFAQLTRDEASVKLRAGSTAYGFVNDIGGLARHPALRTVSVSTPGGPVTLAAPPAIVDGGARALGAVPAIGEHSAAIRAEFSQ
jgi:crotonobetainyl-CoA:carnitine CoA-transferase CaiB-like acyl-CoA transferase